MENSKAILSNDEILKRMEKNGASLLQINTNDETYLLFFSGLLSNINDHANNPDINLDKIIKIIKNNTKLFLYNKENSENDIQKELVRVLDIPLFTKQMINNNISLDDIYNIKNLIIEFVENFENLFDLDLFASSFYDGIDETPILLTLAERLNLIEYGDIPNLFNYNEPVKYLFVGNEEYGVITGMKFSKSNKYWSYMTSFSDFSYIKEQELLKLTSDEKIKLGF